MEQEELLSLRKEELKRTIEKVEAEIREHCRRAGRETNSVQLLPVSKKKPISDILLVHELGDYSFGENYVQELNQKFESLPEPECWHMIGHLQRNKVRQVVGKSALIHSVDSLSLIESIEKEAAKRDMVQDILLEVNVAEEESKWGFRLSELPEITAGFSSYPHLRLRGLMTSAPITENAETNRPYFRALRKALEELKTQNIPNAKLDTLSMGMSGDYGVAIEEGASLIRIGTAIFGERTY